MLTLICRPSIVIPSVLCTAVAAAPSSSNVTNLPAGVNISSYLKTSQNVAECLRTSQNISPKPSGARRVVSLCHHRDLRQAAKLPKDLGQRVLTSAPRQRPDEELAGVGGAAAAVASTAVASTTVASTAAEAVTWRRRHTAVATRFRLVEAAAPARWHVRH